MAHTRSTQPPRILFVCLGNICRSPAAEGVLRALSQQADIPVEIDSAGTADWHQGNPPYGPMLECAGGRGYDLSNLRARQFRTADFANFDLIIAMDNENLSDIEALRPDGNPTPVRLFLDYAPDTGLLDLPDPYFTRNFDVSLDLVETASRGLLADIG